MKIKRKMKMGRKNTIAPKKTIRQEKFHSVQSKEQKKQIIRERRLYNNWLEEVKVRIERTFTQYN
jgi:hypothetical protein